MAEEVRLIRPGERVADPPLPGMIRETAVATDGMWAGLARTRPEMDSGWHHHGDYESAIYVVSGALWMHFGAEGEETLDAEPGDFIFVARGAVHRETNPTGEESEIVVVRAGFGQPVFNVDGPGPTAG
ncbi:MAG: cupin domain-containing protein [Actinomycetota bacterium]